MRIVGIDFGERRIGVAAADDRLRIAIPVETVEVKSDPVADIVKVAEDQRADELVVGLPLSLSGAEGPQAKRIREAVEQLSTRLTIPIHLQDERLTTAEARRVVAVGKGGVGKDAIAASLLLQAYLDSHRPV